MADVDPRLIAAGDAQWESPHDFIRKFHGLPEVVEVLTELVKINPSLVAPILELAMVYGILAYQRRLTHDVELMQQPITPHTSFTYGDLMRRVY